MGEQRRASLSVEPATASVRQSWGPWTGEFDMRLRQRIIALVLFPAGLSLTAAITGCARIAVVYDPFWHDQHRWSHAEERRYRRWEIESDRAHVDFPDRTSVDQMAYWSWLHR